MRAASVIPTRTPRALRNSPASTVALRRMRFMPLVCHNMNLKCTTLLEVVHFLTMPTVRPRYQVTETPEVAQALDRAAKRWPGESRSKLLRRLIEVGGGILEHAERADDGVHRAAVLASSGRYPEAFGPDYLAELRATGPRDRDGR